MFSNNIEFLKIEFDQKILINFGCKLFKKYYFYCTINFNIIYNNLIFVLSELYFLLSK